MNASGAVANGIGQPVRRKEDLRLLTGKGRFADDRAPRALAHAVILRSPHAHADIISIDKTLALAGPGVLAMLAGADYLADRLGPIPHNAGVLAPPDITVRPNGRVELVMGTMSSGQGHETSFAQLLTEWLGVPFESIDDVAHDTARVAAGGGSHSGWSMKLAAAIIGKATREIIDKGRRIAAFVLEVGEADVTFEAGGYPIVGTDRTIDLFAVAVAAAGRTDLPQDLQGLLMAISDETLPVASFPYGSQVCEVDAETGLTEIVRYVAVDDVGRAINPMILHGQTHGGIAQGVGQTLLEHSHYDPPSGRCWRQASRITRCRARRPCCPSPQH